MINGHTNDEANSIANFIEEINQKRCWIMAGKEGVLYGSFIDIEYKYFEGYNVPIKTDYDGKPLEEFKTSYDRVAKFIDLKTKHLITPCKSN